MWLRTLLPIFLILLLAACQQAESPAPAAEAESAVAEPAVAESEAPVEAPSRFDIYAPFRLTADLGHLSDRQKQMIPLLIDAAKIMDDLFWQQAFGDRDALLDGIEDPKMRRFAEMNYGPWDRLDGDRPFVEAYGPKPPGARFYPEDMTKEEFEAWAQEGKEDQYSFVRRAADGSLELLPYHVAFAEPLGLNLNKKKDNKLTNEKKRKEKKTKIKIQNW